jgi:competence protein ComEA
MSFQESAETFRARAHLTDTPTPALVGAAVLAVLGLAGAALGVGVLTHEEPLVVEKAEAAQEQPSQTEAIAEADPAEETPAEGEAAPGNEAACIQVHVAGAVQVPGVYTLPEGSRVCDAVSAASGFSDQAAQDAINQARVLADGEQVYVPTADDVESGAFAGPAAASEQASTGAGEAASPSGKVNINTADASELQQLSGIGPATAEAIVKDREANGPFASVEDLQRVSGIGEKKYAKIADDICV